MRKLLLPLALLAAFAIASVLGPASSSALGPTHSLYLPLVMRTYTSPPPPTSDQLIDAALARGEINAETALSYKVFAAFGDVRLPTRFRGDDHLLPDSHIVAEAQARYATLSVATQNTLNPFLIPPIYTGSWVQTNTVAEPGQPAPLASATALATTIIVPCTTVFPGWTYRDGADVRVWWHTDRPGDAAAANNYIAAMESTIWPKLVPLMGRQPISDGALSCNGGDGKLDIYLEPRVARSMAPANNTPGCRATSAYIVLNPSVSDGILAHEFMHTIQWGYNTRDGCMYPGEYAWLAEATATWAQDYTYPTTNEEHYLADWFFRADSTPSLELKDDAHEYGAYIFFFYLTNRGSDNALVRRAWDYTESNDSLEAVNRAIPGGYEAVWPEFAYYNWNAAPYDAYKRWDGQTVRAKAYLGSDTISGPGLWPMTSRVPHLGLLYKHYTFSSENARLVTFVNGLTSKLSRAPIDEQVGITTVNDGSEVFTFTDLPQPVPGVKVQALFRIEGDTAWQLEDWTGRPHVSFCRDVASERLAELVIIMSNSEYFPRSDWAEPEGLPCQLQVSSLGCWRFTGNATARMWGQGSGGSFEDSQTVQNAVFERLPNEVHPNIPYPYLTFRVTGGQYHHEYTISSSNGCYGHAVDDGTLGTSQILNNLWTLPGVVSGGSLGRYLGYANSNRGMTVLITCPQGSWASPVYPFNWFEPSVLGEVLEKTYTVGALGELAGSDQYPIPIGNAEVSYTWNLRPQREP